MAEIVSKMMDDRSWKMDVKNASAKLLWIKFESENDLEYFL